MSELMSDQSVDFFIPGRPMPQGSKTWYGRGRMVEAVKGVEEWRRTIRLMTRGALGPRMWPIFTEACWAELNFVLPRPRSARLRGWPHVKPDLDKLVRAVFDGLTGLVIADDALVCRLVTEKSYASDVEPTGVAIGIGLL